MAYLNRYAWLLALALVCAFARAENANDDPLLRIDEGKVYRLVNGEPIMGSEVLDVLVENRWVENLTSFIDYAIRREAVDKAKIDVPRAETDAELRRVLKTAARGLGGTLEEVETNFGGGVVQALRRSVEADLGLLKIFQRDNKLTADAKTDSKAFLDRKKAFLEHEVKLSGVITDPKDLGVGEAVRIGSKKYPRDEVRKFILEAEGQVQKSELEKILHQLTIQKLVETAAKEEGLKLSDDDRNFHFSFLARLKEMELGVPGRSVMMQAIQANKMTVEQYLHCRLFSWDALATMIVRKSIRLPDLKKEYAANPELYKTQENLCAHIFVQVLDPDGHPYQIQWQADGHPAINSFVDGRREAQFEAAKSKIDGLEPLAKADFEETARKYSDDTVTRKAGGLLGRIGERAIPVRPLDTNVVKAVMKLKPGEISAPVRSAYGWHILKCLEKQDVTFEEVEERVYVMLLHNRRDDLINKQLIERAKIEETYLKR